MLSFVNTLAGDFFKAVASNPVGLTSAYILYSNYHSWNSSTANVRDVLKRVGSIAINYAFFYFSQSIARATAETVFPYVYGSAPSPLWDPIGSAQWYHNETRMIDYALDYGPMVMPIVGLTLSNYIVDGIEYAGSKVIEGGTYLLFSQRNNNRDNAAPVTIADQSQSASVKRRNK
ncbi:MAG: hypothetical protein HYX61_10480 [Gammaproteobacteria bacterium]|jgi:hypothetical protein|nr:hypothetical protein [Gammaproteobacteria bacterium]